MLVISREMSEFITPVKRRPPPKNEEEEEEEEYSPAEPVPLSAITPGPTVESTNATSSNWGEQAGKKVSGLITPRRLDKHLFGAPGHLPEPPAPPAIPPKDLRKPYYVKNPRSGGRHKKSHKKCKHSRRRATRKVRFDHI